MNIEQYVGAISAVLDQALCLRSFSSELSEKTFKPEVEMAGFNRSTRPLVGRPVHLARSKKECCLIESSINSVRVSFVIKKNDETDAHVVSKFCTFMGARADKFEVVRRVPVEGFDISFLITSEHLERYEKGRLVGFIVDFISNVEKDVA
jgi:actin related protein 2/3 complex, subunit 4